MSPLSGVRVVEVADESGAYAGKLLADLGADVIKVEPPGNDPARAVGPFHEDAPDPNRSLFFWHYNANKRSVVLDLDAEADRERLSALLDAADVLLQTGTPAALARLGLDHTTLAPRHPRLIVAAVGPFGQTGPYREWRSCDLVGQAMGGMAFVNGHPGTPPLRGFGLQAYHCAGLHGAIGILLALHARRKTGCGQAVDVSLQEAVAASVEHVSSAYHLNGNIEVRRGTLHWTRAFRAGRCRDGYVLHTSLGDWTALIEWVKADGKARDLDEPAWQDFAHRQREHEHLFEVLDDWVRDYSVEELVESAQLRRIPYAPVRSLEDLAADPQLTARGFFTPVVHEELGKTLEYPGAPYRFGATPWRLRRRAPLVGEHSDEVFSARQRNTEHRTQTAAPSDVEGHAPPWPAPRETPPPPSAGTTEPFAFAQDRRAPPTGAERSLRGIRVLDFTWVVAGPLATRILADHGAEVIKIERRDATDFGSRRGGLTGNLNRGKRSLVVNMSDARGVALTRELARSCDIVIDNFSSRVMPNWGLDYDHLRALNPSVIAVSMSGFGHSGPRKDHLSYGPTLQALAGCSMLMRHAGSEPAGWGFSYADMVGGYSAALAVLAALWHRDRCGEGQFIDLAQFEALAGTIGVPLLELLAGGRSTAPFGNRSLERPAAPHGVYRCRDRLEDAPAADRWCAICVFSEDEWRRFVGAIGAPEWTAEARFRTLEDRLVHQDELDARVEQWTRERFAEEVMETLQAVGVASGVVANGRDLCERDPQLAARGYWVTLPTPEGGVVTLDGVAAKLSATPGFVAAPAPLLGEHTDEVLRSLLGLEQAAIERLREDGVVA
jgi:crotonobetainyl-CoA:carnitine CoA-transferase CaiB-like acyl-CoA transferase